MAVTWSKLAKETDVIAKSLLTAQGDIIYASAAGTPAVLSAGKDGYVLTSGGAGANPAWEAPAGGSVDYQRFTSSGTWTKPAGCTMVLVDVIGGGGSGQVASAGGGGGGGARCLINLPASGLTSTVTITVGASVSGSGTKGNYSSFGDYVVAQGGEGGESTACGVGGCAGSTWAELDDGVQGGCIGGRNGFKASSSEWGGGSGGSGRSNYYSDGGSSVYAGGGGGTAGYVGGTSGKFGVGGGAAVNTNGADGNLIKCGGGGGGGSSGNGGNGGTPGGGGGGAPTGYTSGNGARGEVRVWAW